MICSYVVKSYLHFLNDKKKNEIDIRWSVGHSYYYFIRFGGR